MARPGRKRSDELPAVWAALVEEFGYSSRKEMLEDLYVNRRMSAAKIGYLCGGLSQKVVLNALREEGIEVRTRRLSSLSGQQEWFVQHKDKFRHLTLGEIHELGPYMDKAATCRTLQHLGIKYLSKYITGPERLDLMEERRRKLGAAFGITPAEKGSGLRRKSKTGKSSSSAKAKKTPEEDVLTYGK